MERTGEGGPWSWLQREESFAGGGPRRVCSAGTQAWEVSQFTQGLGYQMRSLGFASKQREVHDIS